MLPGNTEFEIVRSLTALAHTLGLAVTGEGVEHGDQLGLLEKMGCDNAQGFFIGRPMFPDRLTEFLEQYRYGVPFVGETEASPVPVAAYRRQRTTRPWDPLSVGSYRALERVAKVLRRPCFAKALRS